MKLVDLFAQRLKMDPAGPLITYYDTDTGERIELSATSLANWINKTANFLTDELMVDEGDTIDLNLPLHWQSIVWLQAAWACGVSVDVETLSPRSVVVTSQAHLPSSPADEFVVLSLRPLGLPCDVELPPGALDFATSVRTHGDYFAGPSLGTDRLALVDGQGEFTDSDLVTAWTDTTRGDHERVLFCGTDFTATSIGQAWVATLINQGSLVLVSPSDQSQERLTDLARQEGTRAIIRG
ncbi:MAG: TIGR03089 family protein [Actinomycetes bacterium]